MVKKDIAFQFDCILKTLKIGSISLIYKMLKNTYISLSFLLRMFKYNWLFYPMHIIDRTYVVKAYQFKKCIFIYFMCFFYQVCSNTINLPSCIMHIVDIINEARNRISGREVGYPVIVIRISDGISDIENSAGYAGYRIYSGYPVHP